MRVLVFGASINPQRYAYLATNLLLEKGHEVFLVGLKKGNVQGIEILQNQPIISDIHTITLYVGPQHQQDLLAYITQLAPKRVIFNPGTENPEFYELLKAKNIEYEAACTLVLLGTNQY